MGLDIHVKQKIHIEMGLDVHVEHEKHVEIDLDVRVEQENHIEHQHALHVLPVLHGQSLLSTRFCKWRGWLWG